MSCIRIEIAKAYKKNWFNLRFGDLSGSIEASNITEEMLIELIKEQIKELKKGKK